MKKPIGAEFKPESLFDNLEPDFPEVPESIETFVGAIEGNWKLATYRHSPVETYDIRGFSGDVIFMDRSWIITGMFSYTHNRRRSGQGSFYVRYKQDTDELTIGTQTAADIVVQSATAANSPVEIVYDIQNKKVVFVFRRFHRTVAHPSFGIHRGSYMKAQA